MSQTTIKCPNEECGNTDLSEIEYIEDVLSSRKLEGVAKDGTLYISPNSNEWVEHAENGRFSCEKCNLIFPIPEGIDIEFESLPEADES